VAAWAAVTWLAANSDANFRGAGATEKKGSSISDLLKGHSSKN
jgi:hypothetical protein